MSKIKSQVKCKLQTKVLHTSQYSLTTYQQRALTAEKYREELEQEAVSCLQQQNQINSEIHDTELSLLLRKKLAIYRTAVNSYTLVSQHYVTSELQSCMKIYKNCGLNKFRYPALTVVSSAQANQLPVLRL